MRPGFTKQEVEDAVLKNSSQSREVRPEVALAGMQNEFYFGDIAIATPSPLPHTV